MKVWMYLNKVTERFLGGGVVSMEVGGGSWQPSGGSSPKPRPRWKEETERCKLRGQYFYLCRTHSFTPKEIYKVVHVRLKSKRICSTRVLLRK